MPIFPCPDLAKFVVYANNEGAFSPFSFGVLTTTNCKRLVPPFIAAPLFFLHQSPPPPPPLSSQEGEEGGLSGMDSRPQSTTAGLRYNGNSVAADGEKNREKTLFLMKYLEKYFFAMLRFV